MSYNLPYMPNEKVKILILAGGKGKRMQSENPKVLAELKGKHMIRHLLKSVKKFSAEKPIVIVGYKAELVKKELGDSCIYVLQKELLGTGHAVSSAEDACGDARHVVVLSGDQPFISSETIKNLIAKHLTHKTKITFATTALQDFEEWRRAFLSFGRILREGGEILGIREYRDATETEKSIKEVNAGCYAFETGWLWKNLSKIKNENAQSEYYLTDLIKIAIEQREKIESVSIDPKEALGANTKEELEILEKFAV